MFFRGAHVYQKSQQGTRKIHLALYTQLQPRKPGKCKCPWKKFIEKTYSFSGRPRFFSEKIPFNLQSLYFSYIILKQIYMPEKG